LDFSNNEFNPVDWWGGQIPAGVCIKGESTDQATTPAVSASSNGPLVGSSKSNKYHYPSGSAAKKIAPANLVTFACSAEARAAGMCLAGYAAHHEKRSSILTFFLEFALVLLSELEYLCCHKARRSRR
jgi:hypothetical protein